MLVSSKPSWRGIAQDNAFNYDKGVLADILEPIMGKGLIPADLETWKPRRRAIVPAFHKAYLEASVRMFGDCTKRTITRLDQICASGSVSSLLQNHIRSRTRAFRLVPKRLQDAVKVFSGRCGVRGAGCGLGVRGL